MATRTFPSGVVASPHHLASAAGQAVLADGGNAVDAAVAANLVLAVVTPYHCGAGGDLLAIVWDGAATGVMSVGRAPAGATPQAIRAAIAAGHGDPATALPGTDGMPSLGALPVTVPGAVAGWAHLLERWGSRSLGSLAAPAIRLADEGFVLSAHGAVHVDKARSALQAIPGWDAAFSRMRAGQRVTQPALAASLRRIAHDGPDAVYRGPIGAEIVAQLQAGGSRMAAEDLAAHEVVEVTPLSGRYRDLEVLELPPPTQGITALSALGIIEAAGPTLPADPADPAAAAHRHIEAVRAALADRQAHLADPAAMHVDPGALLAPERLAALATRIDPARTQPWPVGQPAPGGTAYLCAADRDGLLVSLIQSNFMGFGSGLVAAGIALHNRGAHFRLDPAHPAAIAPRRQPPHTLIPALALHDGRPVLVFGTMGGDAQAQIHVQLLARLVDAPTDTATAPFSGDVAGTRGTPGGTAGLAHRDLQAAIDAPRWVVDVADGTLAVEADLDDVVVAGLAARGHHIVEVATHDHLAGHAHAIAVGAHGYAAGSDPRCEGAALGC